jgi:uncharacterized protein (UPF0333 family)
MAFIILVALIAAGFVVYYTIKKTEDRKPSEPVAPVTSTEAAAVVTPEEQAALEQVAQSTQTAQGTQSSSGPLS